MVIKPNRTDNIKTGIFSSQTIFSHRFLFQSQTNRKRANGKHTACSLPKKRKQISDQYSIIIHRLTAIEIVAIQQQAQQIEKSIDQHFGGAYPSNRLHIDGKHRKKNRC